MPSRPRQSSYATLTVKQRTAVATHHRPPAVFDFTVYLHHSQELKLLRGILEISLLNLWREKVSSGLSHSSLALTFPHVLRGRISLLTRTHPLLFEGEQTQRSLIFR